MSMAFSWSNCVVLTMIVLIEKVWLTNCVRLCSAPNKMIYTVKVEFAIKITICSVRSPHVLNSNDSQWNFHYFQVCHNFFFAGKYFENIPQCFMLHLALDLVFCTVDQEGGAKNCWLECISQSLVALFNRFALAVLSFLDGVSDEDSVFLDISLCVRSFSAYVHCQSYSKRPPKQLKPMKSYDDLMIIAWGTAFATYHSSTESQPSHNNSSSVFENHQKSWQRQQPTIHQ